MDYKKILSCLPMPVILCTIPEGDIIYINHGPALFPDVEPKKIFALLDDQVWNEAINQLDSNQTNAAVSVLCRIRKEKYQGKLCMMAEDGRKYAVIGIDVLHTKKQPEPEKEASAILFAILSNILSIGNTDACIQHILDALSRYYQASRIYIFEYSEDKKSVINIYEKCLDGFSSRKAKWEKIDMHNHPGIKALAQNDLIVADDISVFYPEDVALLQSQEIKSLLLHSVKKDGHFWGFISVEECSSQRKWTKEEIQLLQGAAGIVSVLILRKHAEEKAVKSYETVMRVLEGLDSLVFVADFEDSRILFANKKLKHSLNDMAPEGKTCYSLLHDDQSQQCPFCPRDKLVGKDGLPLGPYRWEYYNPKAKKWFYVSDEAIRWVDGRYVHLEQATDITYIKENEQMMEMFAKMDIATGTYKRDWGIARLEAILKKRRVNDDILCICFLDLDGLKYINDHFGHIAGDLALKTIAETIKIYIRETDLICRMGGDEFLIIMNHCTYQNAVRVMKEVDTALEKINAAKEYDFRLSISKGIVEVSGDAEMSVNDIIKQADKEMYREKNKKKQGNKSIYKDM